MEVNVNCSDHELYKIKKLEDFAFDLYDGEDDLLHFKVSLDDIIERPATICKFQQCQIYVEEGRPDPMKTTVFDQDNNFINYTIDTSFHRKSDFYKFGCQLDKSDQVIYTNAIQYEIVLDCGKDKYFVPTAPAIPVFYWLFSGEENVIYETVNVQDHIIHPADCTKFL